jgi:hypothetical protein
VNVARDSAMTRRATAGSVRTRALPVAGDPAVKAT